MFGGFGVALVTIEQLVLGAMVVFAASLIGGISGFGYGLVSAPLLLLIGLPLQTVVVVNLALALTTRVSVVWRFRAAVVPRRVTVLVLGSVPGIVAGSIVLIEVRPQYLKVAVGCLVIVLAPLLMGRRPSQPASTGIIPCLGAGFVGGLLGATTSLNGVPAVLLLSRACVPPKIVIADLAAYFVASNAVALALLFTSTHGAAPDFALPFACWLPGSLAANRLGTSLGPRLSGDLFRKLTLVLILVAGITTVTTGVLA